MRLPDIMELEKFGFYAGFCTSASICTKLTLVNAIWDVATVSLVEEILPRIWKLT